MDEHEWLAERVDNTARNHSSLANRPPITRVRNHPRHGNWLTALIRAADLSP